VEFIARNAPRVEFDAVAQHLGLNGQELGGAMSSLGHSAPTLAKMVKRDYGRREYVVDPEVAKIILEALEEFGA
jgi:hypothetical protein